MFLSGPVASSFVGRWYGSRNAFSILFLGRGTLCQVRNHAPASRKQSACWGGGGNANSGTFVVGFYCQCRSNVLFTCINVFLCDLRKSPAARGTGESDPFPVFGPIVEIFRDALRTGRTLNATDLFNDCAFNHLSAGTITNAVD